MGKQTQSDARGSPHFPQNVFNIVYGQLHHGLRSNPRRRRICFRDMDTSRGRGKQTLSRDDGDLSGIEPLLISPLRSDHSDSNRQLDLRIIPKMPGRHQTAPADLPDLEVVPSLHGSQHPVGSGKSSRLVELSGGSAQQSDQANSYMVGSQLPHFRAITQE